MSSLPRECCILLTGPLETTQIGTVIASSSALAPAITSSSASKRRATSARYTGSRSAFARSTPCSSLMMSMISYSFTPLKRLNTSSRSSVMPNSWNMATYAREQMTSLSTSVPSQSKNTASIPDMPFPFNKFNVFVRQFTGTQSLPYKQNQ